LIKLKTCDSCGLKKPIWKSSGTGGLKLCKQCWSCQKTENNTQKPKNPIPRVSAKKAKQDAEYSKLRQRYLTENPLCMVKWANCTHYSTDVHHIRGGEERSVYYLIQSEWAAVCRTCHSELHLSPAKAREMGWLK
jgi:hypothetical protein